MKDRLGDARVHLNHTLTSYTQDDTSITAHFTQRSDGQPSSIPSMTGSILLAADGINSHARRLLYPTEGPPRFSGRILWRGCIERDPYLTGASMIWAGHANQKFIAYPISAQSALQRNKSVINWIAELRVRDENDPDVTPPQSPAPFY